MVSIILATYNERENLAPLLRRIADCGLMEWEAIVVDDASPDGTGKLADELTSQFPLRVIHRAGKLGLASAIVAGLQAAKGEARIVMDADLSHDEKILPALARAVEQGAELAIGSRFAPGGGMEGWPQWRQFMSRVATLMAQTLFRLPTSDPMSGYFAVSAGFFERVVGQLNPRGYKILLEMIVRGRPRQVREVGFIFRDRQYGKSKVSPKIISAYVRMLVDLVFRRRPHA